MTHERFFVLFLIYIVCFQLQRLIPKILESWKINGSYSASFYNNPIVFTELLEGKKALKSQELFTLGHLIKAELSKCMHKAFPVQVSHSVKSDSLQLHEP